MCRRADALAIGNNGTKSVQSEHAQPKDLPQRRPQQELQLRPRQRQHYVDPHLFHSELLEEPFPRRDGSGSTWDLRPFRHPPRPW